MKALMCAAMGLFEIVLIVACAVIVVGVVVSAIVLKAKGKSGCGGDCAGCSRCPHCKSVDQTVNDETR